MRTVRHYEHCGLRIASDLALPELGPGDGGGRAPDIRVLRMMERDVGPRSSCVFNLQSCSFTAPEAGAYDVRGGRRIAVASSPRADPAMVRLFLLGSAWGAVLHQRGHLPLHAGVTALRGSAIAFCGPSGAGKSTIVASLARRGHDLLSDDLTRLDVGDGSPPFVWPSLSRLKLDRAAIERSGWSTRGLEREPALDKLVLPWPCATAGGPRPLGALFVLTWGRPRIARLHGLDAVRRLVGAATYRLYFHEPPAALAKLWQQVLDVVRTVPIWELSRPKDWSWPARLERELDATLDATVP